MQTVGHRLVCLRISQLDEEEQEKHRSLCRPHSTASNNTQKTKIKWKHASSAYIR
jgi:hypothetical protein